MLSTRFLTDRSLNAPEEFRGSWKCIWSSLSLERQLAVSARLLCARTLLDYLANECTRESLLPVLIRWASRHLVVLRLPTSARHMWREMLYSRNITFVFSVQTVTRGPSTWHGLEILGWFKAIISRMMNILNVLSLRKIFIVAYDYVTHVQEGRPRHLTITRKFEKNPDVVRDENVSRNQIIIAIKEIDKKILCLKNITCLLSNM